MEGLDRDFLQQELVDRPVGTVLFSGGGLQATDAAPDDGLAAVVVPVNAPVKLAAVSAENHGYLRTYMLMKQSQVHKWQKEKISSV